MIEDFEYKNFQGESNRSIMGNVKALIKHLSNQSDIVIPAEIVIHDEEIQETIKWYVIEVGVGPSNNVYGLRCGKKIIVGHRRYVEKIVDLIHGLTERGFYEKILNTEI